MGASTPQASFPTFFAEQQLTHPQSAPLLSHVILRFPLSPRAQELKKGENCAGDIVPITLK
jgi:hypothetical protein